MGSYSLEYNTFMGIDKSMHEGSPIVLIDGTVYQYGKMPEYIQWTDIKREREQWCIEHHSYAKDYRLFGSEQEMMDYIDGLPDSDNPPMMPGLERRKRMTDEEWEQLWEEIRVWRHDLAEWMRRERKTDDRTPEQAFRQDARRDLKAVLDRHVYADSDLAVISEFEIGDIQRQVGLILKHYLDRYRQAIGYEPPPEEPNDWFEPTPPLWARVLTEHIPELCCKLASYIYMARRRVQRLLRKR
jgi:hypothetical protein